VPGAAARGHLSWDREHLSWDRGRLSSARERLSSVRDPTTSARDPAHEPPYRRQGLAAVVALPVLAARRRLVRRT
jgi:hypothetical protein